MPKTKPPWIPTAQRIKDSCAAQPPHNGGQLQVVAFPESLVEGFAEQS
jgi:hypothetical protein